MNNTTTISLATLLLIICGAAEPLWSKEAEFGWYPAEFEMLTATDWPEMKRTLDDALQKSTMTDKEELKALLLKSQFTLNRIAKIKWNATDGKEVEEYLLHFAEELRRRMDPVTQSTEPSQKYHTSITTPTDLAYIAVWVSGKVTKTLPNSQRLVGLWQSASPTVTPATKKIRWAILQVVGNHMSEAEIPELLQRLSEAKPVSKDDVIPLDQLRKIGELARLQNQKAAWEYIWSKTKPERPVEVVTAKFRQTWGEWVVLLNKVYSLDPATAIAIADGSTDQYKKYLFLDAAVCILQNQLLRKSEQKEDLTIDQNLIGVIEVKAQALATQIATSEARKIAGFQNYLSASLVRLKNQSQQSAATTTQQPEAPGRTAPPNPTSPSVERHDVESPLKPQPEKQPTTMIRPEDRGEDFSKLETSEVVRRLTTTDDPIEQRKAAKVLGDREIARALELSEAERNALDRYLDTQLEWTGAAAGRDRTEANDQIQRLWTLSVSKLIDNLGNDSRRVQDAAIKNLILMRNEQIVSQLISRLEASEDPRYSDAGFFALGRMLEKRESLIPDRVSIDDEKSRVITNTLIIPFLDRWEKTHEDRVIKDAITLARNSLKHPLDTRLLPVQTGNPMPVENAPVTTIVTPPPESKLTPTILRESPEKTAEPVPTAVADVPTTVVHATPTPPQQSSNWTVVMVPLLAAGLVSVVVARLWYGRR